MSETKLLPTPKSLEEVESALDLAGIGPGDGWRDMSELAVDILAESPDPMPPFAGAKFAGLVFRSISAAYAMGRLDERNA